MKQLRFPVSAAQGEKSVSDQRAEGSGPRHDRPRGDRQLPQVCGHPGPADHLPALHEDAKEDEEDGHFGEGARRSVCCADLSIWFQGSLLSTSSMCCTLKVGKKKIITLKYQDI